MKKKSKDIASFRVLSLIPDYRETCWLGSSAERAKSAENELLMKVGVE